MSYFLNFRYYHGRDCYKVFDVEMGGVVYSRGVTWHPPEVLWITPMWVMLTEPPRDVCEIPPPASALAPTTSPQAPATAPAPAPAPTTATTTPVSSEVPVPTPHFYLKPPSTVFARVRRGIGHT